MSLKTKDLQSLQILKDQLVDLRHRTTGLGIVEKFLGDQIFTLMNDADPALPDEVLCHEWDKYEDRTTRIKQCDMYLAFHERRISKWLTRLQKGSSEKTK